MIHGRTLIIGSVAVLTAVTLRALPRTDQEDWAAIARAVPESCNSALDFPDHIRAEAELDREERTVRLFWKHDTRGKFLWPFESVVSQPLPTRYIPTVAGFASPNKLVVAGKLGRKVVVEAWTLRPPNPATLASGELILVPNTPSAIRLVYESTDPDRGFVKFLFANRGRPGHSYLIFRARTVSTS